MAERLVLLLLRDAGDERPPGLRLRGLLKRALRSYAFRAVAVCEADSPGDLLKLAWQHVGPAERARFLESRGLIERDCRG